MQEVAGSSPAATTIRLAANWPLAHGKPSCSSSSPFQFRNGSGLCEYFDFPASFGILTTIVGSS